MRDEQRQDEREREDADHERGPAAHELEREPVGDASAQAGVLHGGGNEVGADDHPHLHLGPRFEDRGRIGRAGEDEQCEILFRRSRLRLYHFLSFLLCF